MSITKSFLLREMPNMNSKSPQTTERHYLYNQDSIQLWVERVEEQYELHRDSALDFLNSEKIVLNITSGEFESLKRLSVGSLVYSTFEFTADPVIKIKMFQVPLLNFIRVDVELASEQEALEFVPLDWFGQEITGLAQASDSGLLGLVVN
jgi:adenylate cyclase